MIPEHLSPPRSLYVSFFFQVRNVILSTIGAFLLISGVIWLAVMLYGSFYYFYMGVHLQDFDLQFSFTPCKEAESLRCSVLKSNNLPSFGNYLEQMKENENYHVSVELKLPPSQRNLEHGMFIVCLTLNEEMCLASLPRYKSLYLRNLENTVLLPFHLLGMFTEGEVEVVELIFWEEFQFNAQMMKGINPPRVSINSRTLDVLSGKLRIHPKLWGLSYFMYHHHLISSMIAVSVLSILIGSLLCALWYDILSGVMSKRQTKLRQDMRQEQISNISRRQESKIHEE